MNAPDKNETWRNGERVQASGITRGERATQRRIDWNINGAPVKSKVETAMPSEQKRMVAALHAESCLDLRWRLAIPTYARPLSGPRVSDYYAAKHRRGEYGKYFPLHIVTLTRPTR